MLYDGNGHAERETNHINILIKSMFWKMYKINKLQTILLNKYDKVPLVSKSSNP